MKYFFYSLFAVIIISGCSKSSDNKTSIPQILTGGYKIYRAADTTYSSTASNSTISVIDVESQGGDTTYYNPGTPSATTSVNPQYIPAEALDDTLVFKTATNGILYQGFGGTTTFNYSAQSGTFTSSNQTTGELQRLFILNSTTVEVYTQIATEHYGAFYSKL